LISPAPVKSTAGASLDGDAAVTTVVAWGAAAWDDGVVLRACEEDAAAGFGEVSRTRSSRALRATSHPDKSSSPTPTVCFIRLLIFILLLQVRHDRH
jgi:hypothetical protein